MQDGLLDQLTNYLNINPGCGLVVIDTLQRVRRTTGKAINAYQADYKDVGVLQSLRLNAKFALCWYTTCAR